MKKLIVLMLIGVLSMTGLTACSLEEVLSKSESILDSEIVNEAKDILESEEFKEKVGEAEEYIKSEEFQQKTGEAMNQLKNNKDVIANIMKQVGEQIENAE